MISEEEFIDMLSGNLKGNRTCQICGIVVTYKSSEDFARKTKDWQEHQVASQTEFGTFSITTCPACSQLSFEALVQGYTTRIRNGYDVNFH